MELRWPSGRKRNRCHGVCVMTMEPDSVPVCSAVPPPCSRMTEKPARPTRAPALWSGQKASVPLYRPWLNRRHDPERHAKPGGRGTSAGGLPMPPSELQRLCQSAGGSSELTERPLLIRGESQELRYLQTPKPPLGEGGSNLLFRLMLLHHVGGGCSGQTGDTRGWVQGPRFPGRT